MLSILKKKKFLFFSSAIKIFFDLNAEELLICLQLNHIPYLQFSSFALSIFFSITADTVLALHDKWLRYCCCCCYNGSKENLNKISKATSLLWLLKSKSSSRHERAYFFNFIAVIVKCK